jgi:membrane fusion protein, multidrug efflux system
MSVSDAIHKQHPVVACLVILLCAALMMTGCGRKKKGPPGPQSVPVMAADAVQKAAPLQITSIGNGQASSTVNVSSLVAGTITHVGFAEGQDVAQGAVLFAIDARPFLAQMGQAEAALQRDMAQLANAQVEEKRYATLVAKGYVAQEQYEQFRTNASVLNATVAADKAAVENARLQVEYCTIRSPLSGRTGSLLVHAGNLVAANGGTPLVVINRLEPIYVDFTIPEQKLQDVKKHMAGGKKLKVSAIFPDGDQPAETGVLTFVDNAVDPATGTIHLKATFPNHARRLWPGAFVTVVLDLAVKPDAVVVPTAAVQTGQAGTYIFVIRPDMAVEMRPVAIGQTMQDETVIDSGLRAGEKVVTDGQLRIVPGTRVEIKNGRQTGQGGTR